MDTMAYFGRFNCDVPALMVERAFQKMSAENPDLDFILVPGDYIGHNISMNLPSNNLKDEDPYQMLQDTS